MGSHHLDPGVPRRGALLASLDGLGHAARLERVCLLGRDHASDPALASLIDALLAGDAYEGVLAVHLAQAARDLGRLAGALDHPSLTVVRHAAFYLERMPEADAALEARVATAAPAIRRHLLKGIVRAGRHRLGRALFPGVLAAHGPRDAALLLPCLAASDAASALRELEHGVTGWNPLVRRHPELVRDTLRDALAAAPEALRAAVWARRWPLVTTLADARPADLLALALAFVSSVPWPRLRDLLGALTRTSVEDVLTLLEHPALRGAYDALPIGLLNALDRFTGPQLIRLAQLLRERPESLAAVLSRLAPSRREALLDAVYAGEDTGLREWPEVLLAALPRARQRREAARMLGLAAVVADPTRTLRLTAFLDLAAAQPVLVRAARAADADARGQALALLVACAGRAHDLSGVLPIVAQRMRNEQDPVRLTAIRALAGVPARAFSPSDAPALEAIATSVAEARDTSWSTRQALQELAHKLLRSHAAAPDGVLFTAGLALLRRLAEQTPHLNLPRLDAGMPRGTAARLFAALAPLLRAATDRERPGLLLDLATAFGRRAFEVPELTVALERLVGQKPDSVSSRAISLLLDDPAERDARVARFLAWDPSVIAIAPVHQHLHRRRQEWLDPFLTGEPIEGRFLSGKTIYVLPLDDGFFRWLPRQQRAFAALLERAVADREQPSFTRAHALAVRARLAVTTAADLAPYLAAATVPVREAALGALVWTDRPADALPLLLEHLDGDAARVAMYAMPRCARYVPPAQLAAALAGLATDPARKVTVRKEALRLLGTFRGPGALAVLAGVLAQPELHKDVAIAVGHAARALADAPEALELLALLAAHPEPDVARSLLDGTSASLPAAARAAYAELVLGLLTHPDPLTRRATASALPWWVAGCEVDGARALAARARDLGETACWDVALDGLVALAETAPTGAVLVDTAAALAREAPPEAVILPERDLPARQRLTGLVARLCAMPAHRRYERRAILDAVAQACAAHDDLWHLGAQLTLAATELALPEAAERLRALSAHPLAAAHVDALAAWLEAHAVAASQASPDALTEHAEALGSARPAAARLALALVTAAGRRGSWPTGIQARLAALRAHPDVAVRAAARDVIVHPEPVLTLA